MRTIWKFQFEIAGKIHLDMPIGAHLITAEMQDNTPCLWAEVDPSASKETRTFHLYGTGHDIPDGVTHVSSFQMPPFVWHLYEE